MTLLLDSREGSYQLATIEPIRSLLSHCPDCSGQAHPPKPFTSSPGITCASCRSTGRVLSTLDSGDIAFTGIGPNESPILIGIEFKSIPDLIDSLRTKRLNGIDGQIDRMLSEYQVNWILHYGRYRPNPKTGILQTFSFCKREQRDKWFDNSYSMLYAELEAFLSGPSLKSAGFQVKRVETREEACAWIATLYFNYQKPYRKHTSLECLSGVKSQSTSRELRSIDPNHPNSHDDRWKQRVNTFSSIPSIGYDRAVAMADHFPSVLAGMNASIDRLAEVEISVRSSPPRKMKLGRTIARSFWEKVR